MNTVVHIRKSLSLIQRLFGRGIHFVYKALIAPKALTEDNKRKEFILNTILAVVIPILILLDVFVDIASHEEGVRYRGISFLLFSSIVLGFIWLLFMSRKGYYKAASFAFLIVYFVAATYGALRWGVELPLVAISYILIIIISSIVISTRFSFIATIWIALTLVTVTLLQIKGVIVPSLGWKHTGLKINDPIELSVFLFLITTISWLSNKEIESSLRRARQSERDLKQERDQLEITVEERTKEVQEMQKEKISQLYRFAEFGRLSSGVFHDLMNSLHSVALNVGQLEQNSEAIPQVQEHLDKAVTASKRMSSYIQKVRKQIAAENIISAFSVQEEIENAVDMMRFKAQEASVAMTTVIADSPILRGNALKLYQVMLNLIGNAIEACEENMAPGSIEITLNQQGDTVVIAVKDNGSGITPELQEIIFTPFFTTKKYQKGIGLGLSQTKEIVEQEFEGAIEVISRKNSTVFIIKLPINTAHGQNGTD